MFKMVRVQDHSMSPLYESGDFLLLRCRFTPALGQRVVFGHPLYGTMVKEIIALNPLRVKGLNPVSISSEKMGDIEPHWLIGKVIWHIAKTS